MMGGNSLFYMQLFLDLGYRKLLAVFEQIDDHDAQWVGHSPQQLGHFFELCHIECFGINIGHVSRAACLWICSYKSRIKKPDMLTTPLRNLFTAGYYVLRGVPKP